ncbi:ATP-dependent helicase HrpB [Motiliproteus sediminis]|uniref:ATP-dependent helicase HrpB n=1 Tax=Motiliproteus sediminis TaxID=1468178 RepID=UPI001AEF7B9D|nr:ATP-dependent helicase HrpB [Motiliproteus sediminis]
MSLPIEQCLPALQQALNQHNRCLLQADPGAGKTTRVPLALLDAPWLQGRRIVMLEPRRLAARNASRFMAAQLGEQPGETVGHRTRLETRVGKNTRIEVVTEGVLTRLLQRDPELTDVGCVILDEFHERNLQSDLALALLLECQSVLREDLRLLLMSATLDSVPLLTLLGSETPLIASAGRCYPVATHYLGGRPEALDCRQLATTLQQISRQESGSLLCFLPGVGEIRRTQQALAQLDLPSELQVRPLYGALPSSAQDLALRPAKQGRKLVLTTAIAETSLTIEGVRVVVDAGLMRLPRFDPPSGMSRLVTQAVSQAGAEQRRGRAGRLEPGACYRLWSEERQAQLLPQRPAEILSADLAPLRLELAQWGTPAEELHWLDPPPKAHLDQAQALLKALGALDADGRLTPRGQAMLELGAHPRLGAMMLRARELNLGALGCDLAALLNERLPSTAGADLGHALAALRRSRSGELDSARQSARRWRRQLQLDTDHEPKDEQAGLLLSFAFPDRIAQQRRPNSNQYRLSNGRGAHLAEQDPLRRTAYLVAAEVDGDRSNARIYAAAAVSQEELAMHHPLQRSTAVSWDEQQDRVQALSQTRLGQLILEQRPLSAPDPEAVADCLLQALQRRGGDALPWTRDARSLQARVQLLRRHYGTDWPDFSDAALMTRLDLWLKPYLDGATRLTQLTRLDLAALLRQQLSWPQQQQLEREAPVRYPVPSGSQISIDYTRRDEPVLAVKLQELFGLTTTPAIVGGAVPLLLELLSPAQRPIQTTRDLANFWRNTYHEVKKDLKGRYPKHPWPDDPLTAEPTRGTKKRPHPPAN